MILSHENKIVAVSTHTNILFLFLCLFIPVVFEDFMYVVTISSNKIYVCKRKHVPQEPVTAWQVNHMGLFYKQNIYIASDLLLANRL